MTIDICPACGYPMIGVELCAYCVPVQAVSGHYPFSLRASGQPRFRPAQPVPWTETKPDVVESNQALQAG